MAAVCRRSIQWALSQVSRKKTGLQQPWLASPSWPLFFLPATSPFAFPALVRRLSAASPPDLPTVADPRDRSACFLSLWTNYESRVVHSSSRDLIAILLRRRWSPALERDLKRAGVKLDRRIVDEVVACIPNPRLALQFYVWAGEQIGYPKIASRAACNIFQWYAGKAKLVPFLMALKNLHQRHFELSPPTVNVLIQGYGWAGMLERAFGVMARAHGFGNDILVKCLLCTITKERRYDMVYAVYTEIKKQPTCCDLFYNELIQGLALGNCQKWDEVDLLLKQASDSGHALEDKTINNLLWAMSRAGQHGRAYAILSEIMQKKKVRLENKTVAAVVESLCHAKEIQRAARVIEDAKQYGVVVPVEVYDKLMLDSTCNPGPGQ